MVSCAKAHEEMTDGLLTCADVPQKAGVEMGEMRSRSAWMLTSYWGEVTIARLLQHRPMEHDNGLGAAMYRSALQPRCEG